MPRSLAKPDPRSRARARIEELIRRERLWGRRLLSERDLASALGVCRWTVQCALAEMEAEGLVIRRHGSGTLVAERPPARARKTARLAVIAARPPLPDGQWEYASELVRGVLAHAPRLRAECTVFYLDQPEHAGRLGDERELGRFDGFISVAQEDRGLLSRLLELGRGAVVLLDHYVRDLPIVGVVDGSFESARAAARHLLALGHRRIAFLDCPDRANTNPEKYGGCRAALLERDVFDESLVLVPPSVRERELESFLDAALERLLGLPDPPTAAFCFDDNYALVAIRALEKRGLRVGPDFSLAGHGDSAFRRGACGWLTSCRIHVRRMGREAVVAALGGRPRSESRIIIVPNRLLVRKSTCPPRALKER
jgi:DNA-binding LacI/PurR family transcriptional regulator